LAQADVETILLKQLASCLRIPIALLGPRANVLFYNEPAEPIYGRRFEESGGIDMGRFLRPSDASGTPLKREERPLMIALDRGIPAHRPLFIRSGPDGWREIEITGIPLLALDGRRLGAMGLFWDPTERIRSTGPLSESGGQRAVEMILTRRVAARLAAPIFLTDAEGNLLYFNAAAAEILGHPFADMLRESRVKLYKAFHPRDEAGNTIEMDEHPMAIARKQQRPVHRRFWIRALDGHDRKIAGTAIPLIGQCDRLLGAFGVFWEIEAS
jgi:PAS domain-containing protein